MGYRTIVVGTDGSATANVARDAAVRMAKRWRAELVLVCAYDPPRMSAALARTVADRAIDAARQAGVEATAELGRAEPTDLILQVAEGRDADLLVVGNKGMGQPSRFRLGSVAERVAHFAPCDLLIVDTSRFADPDRPAPGQYRRILAATDGSPTATEASRKAFELALMLGADVTLVYVGDPIVGAIKLEDTARSRPEGVDVETKIVQGDPAEQICAVAEAQGADLLVVGNKGMSGARRFLLGSVPNRVAHYSPADVLIAKTVDLSILDVEPGHGAVLEMDGRKTAAYKDEGGRVIALSPRCTHMGCIVDWNDADKTWDCPCHGSRYSFDGKVIQGPAVRGLDGPEGQDERPVQPPADRTVAPRTLSRKGDRFVIVGASLTGGTAAATLRQEGFDGRLELIGAENHYPYERPPLSKSFLRGETAFEEALVQPVSFYRDNEIVTRFSTRATSIDPSDRIVVLDDGETVPFDRMLIATGARNRRFLIPGLDLPGVYDLRSVGDAERIRAEMSPGRRVVIAGMGFIGSEVAASLRQRGVEVASLDGGKVPLHRVLGEDVGRVMTAIHRDHGVELHFEDRVASFEGSGRVEAVVTANGLRLDCDFAIVGMGVEPVTDLLHGSGIEVDNGVLVDELCRTNVEGIYAAGDVANHLHPVFGRRLRIEHWQNAIKQGRAAAINMLDRNQPYDEIHWFWSDQYEHNLQYAGYHTEWDEVVIRGSLEARDFLAFYVKDGRIQAAVGMDRGREVIGSMALIKRGATVGTIDLRDEAVDLAALA
jgi:3-phenylpropionate/trans-cinnamate dioxygenase ferredoxin reductase subunit